MHSLHHTLLDYCKYLMIQSYLWQMVHTRVTEVAALDILEESAGRGQGKPPHGNTPPPPPRPPVSLEQLLTMQNELMQMLMQNEACCGACRPQHP
jgi:hypothetical protein